jgi:hypothetical protein
MKKNNLELLDLKGRVKSLKEISYQAVEKLGKILKGKLDRQQDTGDDFYYLFNEYGNISESIIYSSNDGSPIVKFSDKYDEFGNKIETNQFYFQDNRNSKTTYKYNDKGNKIEEIHYNSNGSPYTKTIKKYNDKGNEIESYDYKSDGSLESKWTRKYDDTGKLIEMNYFKIGINNRDVLVDIYTYMYDNNGIKLEDKRNHLMEQSCWIDTYKYDDKGRMIEQTTHRNGSFFSDLIYIYDDTGKIIEGIEHNPMYQNKYAKFTLKYDESGQQTGLNQYDISDNLFFKVIYLYDNQKNWIQKITYKNNSPQHIIERAIEYY